MNLQPQRHRPTVAFPAYDEYWAQRREYLKKMGRALGAVAVTGMLSPACGEKKPDVPPPGVAQQPVLPPGKPPLVTHDSSAACSTEPARLRGRPAKPEPARLGGKPRPPEEMRTAGEAPTPKQPVRRPGSMKAPSASADSNISEKDERPVPRKVGELAPPAHEPIRKRGVKPAPSHPRTGHTAKSTAPADSSGAGGNKVADSCAVDAKKVAPPKVQRTAGVPLRPRPHDGD